MFFLLNMRDIVTFLPFYVLSLKNVHKLFEETKRKLIYKKKKKKLGKKALGLLNRKIH